MSCTVPGSGAERGNTTQRWPLLLCNLQSGGEHAVTDCSECWLIFNAFTGQFPFS